MNINELNKTDLLKLRNKIDEQLIFLNEFEIDQYNRKSNIKNKTKLSQLSSNDALLNIQLAHNGMIIYHIGYCDVTYYNENTKNKDYHDIRLESKTKPIGLTTSICKEQADKHFFLSESCSITNFFTMKPETWEIDLKEALKDNIQRKNKLFKNEINDFKNKIKTIVAYKKEINKEISQL